MFSDNNAQKWLTLTNIFSFNPAVLLSPKGSVIWLNHDAEQHTLILKHLTDSWKYLDNINDQINNGNAYETYNCLIN